MNRQEVAAVFGLFGAAWPNTAIPEATMLLWASELARTDPQVALDAARALVRSSKWFPSISEMLEACKSIRRTTEGVPALSEGSLDRETQLRLVREARGALAAVKGAQHDHRGPTPCRVCGGMKSS